MSKKSRVSIFEDSEIDVSGFRPKAALVPGPAAKDVRAIAEAADFRSRESKAEPPIVPKREPRRHRTGRNVQLNVKALQGTIDELYRISDAQGWVLGETLAHALAALGRELGQAANQVKIPRL